MGLSPHWGLQLQLLRLLFPFVFCLCCTCFFVVVATMYLWHCLFAALLTQLIGKLLQFEMNWNGDTFDDNCERCLKRIRSDMMWICYIVFIIKHQVTYFLFMTIAFLNEERLFINIELYHTYWRFGTYLVFIWFILWYVFGIYLVSILVCIWYIFGIKFGIYLVYSLVFI